MTKAVFKKLSDEEKREIVISRGTESQYINCPMCGFSNSTNMYLDGRRNFTSLDLERAFILTTRVGGGKGSGFFRIDEKCYTIHEVKNMPQYQGVMDQIREQAERIIEALK